MKFLKSTKALILVSILGLTMAIGSTVCAQTFDAGPPGVTESPVAGSENPTDIAPTEPTLPAEATKAAGRESETAPDSAEPENTGSDSVSKVANPAKEATADTADDVYQAFEAGKWLVAFGGILMFMVWIFRSVLLLFDFEWAEGELGGNIVAFGTASLLAIGIALSAGQGLSIGLISAAVGAGWLAKGQWSHAQAKKKKDKASE